MALSTGPDPSQSLWDEACNLLPDDLKVTIQDIEVQRVGVLEDTSKAVTEKLNAHLGQSLKFKKPGGGEVVVRHALEKYIKWVDCFKGIGDQAIQYDPGHAALPWAAVRFVLQATVNAVEAFNILIANIEKISHMIKRHALSEVIYRQNTKPIGQELRKALKTLYTSILTYLAKAIRHLKDSRLKRLVKDAFKLPADSDINNIQDLDAAVDKFFNSILAHESAEMQMQIRSVQDTLKRLEPTIEQTLRRDQLKDENDEWLKYLQWLSPIDFEDQHREVRCGRLKYSAEWIIQHEEVVEWRDSGSSSMLLIDGVPGSGKSKLASKVIDSLKERSEAVSNLKVAYFYCSRSSAQPERQSPSKILTSILRQLVVDQDPGNMETHRRGDVFAEFKKRKEKATGDGFQPYTLSSTESISLISGIAKSQHVFLVLDGFDEVEARQRIELAGSLKSLLSDPNNLVKVLITSRDDSQVTGLLSGARGLRISPDHNKDDIERLIRYRLEQSKTSGQGVFAGKTSADFKNQVCDSLLRGSGEMFLLAELQLHRLSLAGTEADGRQVLVSLPEDITAAYEGTMGMIKNSGSRSFEIAVKTFQWLLYAKAPISVNALIYAISQANLGAEIPDMIDATSLVRICRNLIKVDGPVANLNRVRFAHSTVQEFLLQRPEFAAATSNQAIASTCLQICTEGIADNLSTDPEWMTEFHRYATLYWTLHYQEAPKGSLSRQLSKFVYDEFQGSSIYFEEWMEGAQNLSKELPRDHALRRDYLRLNSSTSTALFTACLFGLEELLDPLDSPDFLWGQPNDLGYTALYLAAYHGYTQIVEYLIKKKVDVNAKCSDFGSPLHIACFRGHVSVVVTLLHHGACPKQPSKMFGDAMEAAGRGGHEAVAQVLVEKELPKLSADEIDVAIKSAGTNGFFDVIAKLEAFKKEAQSTKKRRIMESLNQGHTDRLDRMIGGDPELQRMLPYDSIAIAALNGNVKMLEFLLKKGLSIEASGPSGRPLRIASLRGHVEFVKVLLKRGAKVQDVEAINAASMKGHLAIVRTLVEALNVSNKRRQSLLEDGATTATSHNQLEVLKYLANVGADIDAPELANKLRNMSVQSGYERIVLFLMDRHEKRYGHVGHDDFPSDPTQGK